MLDNKESQSSFFLDYINLVKELYDSLESILEELLLKSDGKD